MSYLLQKQWKLWYLSQEVKVEQQIRIAVTAVQRHFLKGNGSEKFPKVSRVAFIADTLFSRVAGFELAYNRISTVPMSQYLQENSHNAYLHYE